MKKGGRFDDMLAALRRVSGAADDLGSAGRAARPALKLPPADKAEFCEGCHKPECDFGCAYAPKRKEEPVPRFEPRPVPPSIHEPIVPFGAPMPKATIADAFRRTGQEVAAAIDNMLATCEEARAEGVRLIEALYAQGEWHDEFLAGYVSMQTDVAAAMRDTWKKQVEDLRNKQLAITQQTAPTTEGETP